MGGEQKGRREGRRREKKREDERRREKTGGDGRRNLGVSAEEEGVVVRGECQPPDQRHHLQQHPAVMHVREHCAVGKLPLALSGQRDRMRVGVKCGVRVRVRG
eukprot:3398847-Rhodomonas_salina.1